MTSFSPSLCPSSVIHPSTDDRPFTSHSGGGEAKNCTKLVRVLQNGSFFLLLPAASGAFLHKSALHPFHHHLLQKLPSHTNTCKKALKTTRRRLRESRGDLLWLRYLYRFIMFTVPGYLLAPSEPPQILYGERSL